NWFNEIFDHHSVGPECARRAIVDPGARKSKADTRRTYRRWCEVRFSRTQRDPRRADATLQHVSPSLALCSDSQPPPVTKGAYDWYDAIHSMRAHLVILIPQSREKNLGSTLDQCSP